MLKGKELENYINEYLSKAYKEDELKLLDASYQDEFKDEGGRKSEYIIEDLRERAKHGAELNSLILLSIGGADGSEVVSILEKTQINKALMIEISQEGADLAKAKAIKLSRDFPEKEFKVICGDAMKSLDEALDAINCWRKENPKLDGLVLSCQAVLHELPRRSDGYDHGLFFGKTFKDGTLRTKAVYIKEPCFPENWRGQDEILVKIPGVCGDSLKSFATHVSDKLRLESNVEGLADDYVRLTPELALETLHKLIRKNPPSRLFYELGEQLTSVSIADLKNIVKGAVGLSCRDRPIQTDGFYKALRLYDVEFQTKEYRELNDPQSHVTIVGFKTITQTKPQELTSRESSPASQEEQTEKSSDKEITHKVTWRKEDYNFDGYKIEKMPLIELFQTPLLKADVVSEIEQPKEIPEQLKQYYDSNIDSVVKAKLSAGKALTNGKGYSLKRILIQKDPAPQGGRNIRPHLTFEPAEYYQQLMYSERLDVPDLIENEKTIRDTFDIQFESFDWPMVAEIPIPQRYANVVGLVLPISFDKPNDLCMVVAIRSNQTLVSDDSNSDYYQSSMSCAEGMLRPDDAEYGMSDRYPPSPFNTAMRALKEELNVVCGAHYLERDVEMLALGYDSNRCQPVSVFKVETNLLCFEDLVSGWVKAKDRNENRDLLPIMLTKEEYIRFLNGNIYYQGKPIRMFSNHQLLGACVIGRHYLGSLE